MARYTKPADRPDTERIPAGGGFDEDWIEVRRPTLEMYERVLMRSLGDEDSARLMRLRLAALMIGDWSFTDDAGQKLPISYEQIAGADDMLAKALEPVLERAADFLASRLSTIAKPATSS